MTVKAKIMDDAAMRRALSRIAHEIVEKNQGAEDMCLLGVRTRGVPLAAILRENIENYEGIRVPMGWLDITMHRDDISPEAKVELAGECHIPCDINDKRVVIVDDVFFTGRTARAAMESVFAYGRPRSIQLAVLVDRGHRELPLRADYVGKNVPTSINEEISVRLKDMDGEDAVYICDID